MKKGVTGLQNIQLLKWCKEIGVHPIWNFLIGIPAASRPTTTSRWRPVGARLPPAEAVGRQRDPARSLQPELQPGRPARVHQAAAAAVLRVPLRPARSRRATTSPTISPTTTRCRRTCARYADPLVKQRARVEDDLEARRAGLGRPRRSAVRVRHPAARPGAGVGADRRGSRAVSDLRRDHRRQRARRRRAPSGCRRIAGRGLMLNEGAKYLSLAVPVGDYQPSREAMKRLRPLFATPRRRGSPARQSSFHVRQSSTNRRLDGEEEGWKEEGRNQEEGGRRRRRPRRRRSRSATSSTKASPASRRHRVGRLADPDHGSPPLSQLAAARRRPAAAARKPASAAAAARASLSRCSRPAARSGSWSIRRSNRTSRTTSSSRATGKLSVHLLQSAIRAGSGTRSSR